MQKQSKLFSRDSIFQIVCPNILLYFCNTGGLVKMIKKPFYKEVGVKNRAESALKLVLFL